MSFMHILRARSALNGLKMTKSTTWCVSQIRILQEMALATDTSFLNL